MNIHIFIIQCYNYMINEPIKTLLLAHLSLLSRLQAAVEVEPSSLKKILQTDLILYGGFPPRCQRFFTKLTIYPNHLLYGEVPLVCNLDFYSWKLKEREWDIPASRGWYLLSQSSRLITMFLPLKLENLWSVGKIILGIPGSSKEVSFAIVWAGYLLWLSQNSPSRNVDLTFLSLITFGNCLVRNIVIVTVYETVKSCIRIYTEY